MILKRLHRMGISIVLFLLMAILVVVFLLHLFGNRALKLAVETAGTKTLNVGVTVEDVSFSILNGTFRLKNLVIRNPSGFQTPSLIEMDLLEVKADMASFLRPTVNLKTIQLDALGLTVEQKGLSNNLQEVLDHVSASRPKAPSEPKQPSEGKQVLVDVLEITNTSVQVKLLPIPGQAKDLSLKLTPIRMENLSSGKPITIVELTAKILAAIVEGLNQQAGDILPAEIAGPLKSFLSTGDILNTGKEALDKVLKDSRIEEPAKEILQQGQDILNILGGGKKKEEPAK